MTTLTYSELFAGAGGLSLGLDAAGFHAAAHAEIEPHARAVLRYRWPDTRLDGDVTKIDGADYTGITLLSGGSPCQDLSVAGKRAGLTGSRSSLFHEQCRIWRESDAPYLLWENVLGALSSNDGADFAIVLSTIVGSTVHVPGDGWRGGGGVVAGRDAVAAWRVLDLQHFGPPQRRVRVFILAARAGGVDPAEVLALNEGVCRHPSPRQQSRESVAARARGGVKSSVAAFTEKVGEIKSYGDVTPCLLAGTGETGNMLPRIIAWDKVVALNISNGVPSLDDTMGTLDTDGASTTAIGAQTRGVVIGWDQELNAAEELMGTLKARVLGGGHENGVLAYGRSSFGGWDGQEVASPVCSRDAKDASSIIVDQTLANGEDVTATLTVAYADKQGLEDQHVNSGCPLFAMAHGQSNASVDTDMSPTLTALHEAPILFGAQTYSTPAIGDIRLDDVASTITKHTGGGGETQNPAFVVDSVLPTLAMGAHTSGPGSNGQDALQYAKVMTQAQGRPRRLTPLECERLMSWPDTWTATGRKDDGTEYALSDTARYRLCGNGVGSVCAEWIGRRLIAAITAQVSA